MSENVMKMDEKYFKGFAKFLETNVKIGVEPEDLALIIKGHYQHVGETLGENKSENEPFVLSLPEYVDYKVSYREGAGESAGNFGIGVVAGSELKKRIKDDEALEDLDEDTDYSDEDED